MRQHAMVASDYEVKVISLLHPDSESLLHCASPDSVSSLCTGKSEKMIFCCWLRTVNGDLEP